MPGRASPSLIDNPAALAAEMRRRGYPKAVVEDAVGFHESVDDFPAFLNSLIRPGVVEAPPDSLDQVARVNWILTRYGWYAQREFTLGFETRKRMVAQWRPKRRPGAAHQGRVRRAVPRPRARRERRHRHVARSTSSADPGDDGDPDPDHHVVARPGRALQPARGLA